MPPAGREGSRTRSTTNWRPWELRGPRWVSAWTSWVRSWTNWSRTGVELEQNSSRTGVEYDIQTRDANKTDLIDLNMKRSEQYNYPVIAMKTPSVFSLPILVLNPCTL